MANSYTMVVEHSPHNSNAKGLSPAVTAGTSSFQGQGFESSHHGWHWEQENGGKKLKGKPPTVITQW
jgi:hypothetical protein